MSKNGFIFVLILCVIFYVAYGYSIDSPSFENLKIIGVVALFQFIVSVFSSIKQGQKLISPYIVFFTVMFIFQGGQSLMYPFDILSQRDLVGFLGITITDVFKAQILTFSFLAFFQIGSLLCNLNATLSFKPISISKNQNKRILQIGWFLAIISVYPYYQELIHNVILSMIKGYGALYEGEEKIGIANIQSMIGDYFIPALICLYIGYRDQRIKRLVITGILLFNCVVILATGGRTEAVIIMTLLLILRNYLVRPFTKKEISLIGVGTCFILILLAGISRMRSDTSRDFKDTFALSEEAKNNGVVDAVGEMGASMFCQIWTENIISVTQDYRYGSSYLYAFTSVIPNLGFWKIHPAKEKANLGNWLTNEKGLGFGTGYSMVAEAYINFGIFGSLMMLLLGFIFTKFFGYLGVAITQKNIAFIAFILIFFWFSLKLPRNSFIGAVRAIFYFALPIYWYTRGYIIKRSNL